MSSKPLLIAHRGDTKNYPENTLESFASAFQKGADGIEFDVHLDDKDQMIVVHNYLHDRTQNYPLLSTVLERFKNNGLLEIELKSFNPVCISKVKELIEYHSVNNYKLTTSIQPLVHHMRELFPTADIGLIFRRWLLEPWMTEEFICDWVLAHLQLSGANYLHLDLDQYTFRLAKYTHSHGYKLHSHLKTASLQDLKKVHDLGIDTCTFDDIDILNI